MLYALIMYCTGLCPATFPPPSGVLLYTSLADCEADKAKFDISTGRVVDEHGKPIPNVKMRQTCATMYSDPKQLDRLLNPKKLAQMLEEHSK